MQNGVVYGFEDLTTGATLTAGIDPISQIDSSALIQLTETAEGKHLQASTTADYNGFATAVSPGGEFQFGLVSFQVVDLDSFGDQNRLDIRLKDNQGRDAIYLQLRRFGSDAASTLRFSNFNSNEHHYIDWNDFERLTLHIKWNGSDNTASIMGNFVSSDSNDTQVFSGTEAIFLNNAAGSFQQIDFTLSAQGTSAGFDDLEATSLPEHMVTAYSWEPPATDAFINDGIHYFVSPTGSDTNSGTSEQAPLKTIHKAAQFAQPGDTVFLMDGVHLYTGGGNMATIYSSGTPDAWITYRPLPGTNPVLKATSGWDHLNIQGSYLIFDGIVIEGNNDNINYEQAKARYDAYLADPSGIDSRWLSETNTGGIKIDGRQAQWDGREPPHHIVIRNCVVSKCPGSGIAATRSDYVIFENNKVFENAWYMIFGGSGITIHSAREHSQSFYSGDHYRIIVRGNDSYRNATNIPWEAVDRISDGNGIIIDLSMEDVVNNPPYGGRMLVANNVVYKNGGSGIHSYRSGNIDIVFNTIVANNQRPELRWGNLFAKNSSNIWMLYNIVVAHDGGLINDDDQNTGVVFGSNVYYNGEVRRMGQGDRVIDPEFSSFAERPFTPFPLRPNDFTLSTTSPAIGQGVRWSVQ